MITEDLSAGNLKQLCEIFQIGHMDLKQIVNFHAHH